MSKRDSRSGGKFCGNHTTFISAAALVADLADECPAVTTISSGVIESPRNRSGSRRHVKIVDTDYGVLLSVTDGAAHQEVRLYVSDAHKAKFHVARGARNANLTISFGDQRTKHT